MWKDGGEERRLRKEKSGEGKGRVGKRREERKGEEMHCMLYHVIIPLNNSLSSLTSPDTM